MASDYKRAHLRKKVAFPFEVTSAERDGAALSLTLRGRVFSGVEISAGGMGFETDAPLRRGDRLGVRFQLPGETHVLKLVLLIMHISPLIGPAKKGFVRAGAKFERLDPAEMSYLTNYIGTTFLLY